MYQNQDSVRNRGLSVNSAIQIYPPGIKLMRKKERNLWHSGSVPFHLLLQVGENIYNLGRRIKTNGIFA